MFIAQLGTGGDSWAPVLELLTSKATTVTYDRPGTGGAPPRPAPNPALPYSGFGQELADLLDAQGVTGPAVVVGHSFGSLITRAYATLRPERVAGLVLVDGSIPQFRLAPTAEPILDGGGPHATGIDTIAGQVEILSATLPRVPAVVVARRRHWWSTGFANIPNPAMDDLWHISQRNLARELDAPLVVADAGHQIPAERPGLVAYAVDKVVKAVRSNRRVELDTDWLKALGGHLEP